MATLLLDNTYWDWCIDATGDIAVATEPYSLAQDAASALRLFKGELFYDTTQGIDYFGQDLGKSPPLSLVRSQMETAALTVPGVVTAKCYFTRFEGRRLFGQVQITDSSGNKSAASF